MRTLKKWISRSLFCFLLAGLLACGTGKTPRGDQGAKISFQEKPVITFGDDAEKELTVEWLTPLSSRITAYGQLVIELKAKSSKPLDDSNFQVFVGGVQSKAGETSLLPSGDEYVYQAVIDLDNTKDLNVIEVIVMNEAGRVEAAPRFVEIDENPTTTVSWIEPNPVSLAGKPYVHNIDVLGISLNIETYTTLRPQDVDVYFNEEKLLPSGMAELKGQAGKYNFSDYINISSAKSLNTVYVEVNGQKSAVLKLVYEPLEEPNLYIISVGTKTNLRYTEKDAKDFADLFAQQGGKNKLFGKISVVPVLGDNANASEIKGSIEELKAKYLTRNIKTNDVIIIFLSSHGFLYNDDFRLQASDYNSTRVNTTSVSYHSDIIAILEEIPCKKLIFIDACHAGGAKGEKNAVDPYQINLAIQRLNKVKAGIVTIASSQENESSYEDKLWYNGAFTQSILDGLAKGYADADSDKIISINELFQYIEKAVPKMVRSVKGKDQHPKMTRNELGDVPIFIVTQ